MSEAKPLTAEEEARFEQRVKLAALAFGENALNLTPNGPTEEALRLLATIRAERERADSAEMDCERWEAQHTKAVEQWEPVNELLKIQTERAESFRRTCESAEETIHRQWRLITTAEKERDEARAELTNATRVATDALQERNEARAEVETLKRHAAVNEGRIQDAVKRAEDAEAWKRLADSRMARLEADNERLRAALQYIADGADNHWCRRAAREALADRPDSETP